MERQGAAALELEHEGDEPVGQRFRIPPGTRQLLRPRAVGARIRELAPADSPRPYGRRAGRFGIQNAGSVARVSADT